MRYMITYGCVIRRDRLSNDDTRQNVARQSCLEYRDRLSNDDRRQNVARKSWLEYRDRNLIHRLGAPDRNVRKSGRQGGITHSGGGYDQQNGGFMASRRYSET